MLPVAEDVAERLEREVVENLPGGQHLVPRWQDGPYHLVQVAYLEDAPWMVATILDGHVPIVARFPTFDPTSAKTGPVYAVSQFTQELLRWHVDPECGYSVPHLFGPFPTVPGYPELVTALPRMFASAGSSLLVRDALAEVSNPEAFLAVLQELPTPKLLGERDGDAIASEIVAWVNAALAVLRD